MKPFTLGRRLGMLVALPLKLVIEIAWLVLVGLYRLVVSREERRARWKRAVMAEMMTADEDFWELQRYLYVECVSPDPVEADRAVSFWRAHASRRRQLEIEA